jgi:hypothetical protein
MAGAGAKKFPAFSKLSSADVNDYLADQVIMRFATTTARDAAFGGVGEPTLAEGMTAYIDDLNSVQVYDGSNWVEIANTLTKAPRGVMGYAIGSANSAFTSIADISGMSVTFTAVANRLYKANFSCTLDQNSTATSRFFVTDGSNTELARYDTLAVAGQTVITFSYLFTVAAGSVTRKIRASMSGGAATVLYTAGSYAYNFSIEDMGAA